VSSAVLGAAVGSAGGGFLSDRRGRKAALKLADAFFVAGAMVMALSPHVSVLILGGHSPCQLSMQASSIYWGSPRKGGKTLRIGGRCPHVSTGYEIIEAVLTEVEWRRCERGDGTGRRL